MKRASCSRSGPWPSVAPYCRARLARKRLRRSLLQALDVKQGAVRKPTREADDAGLAQQLEQLADGGGFDVEESVGKGQGHGVKLGSQDRNGSATQQAPGDSCA
jgi:hypothetical protein